MLFNTWQKDSSILVPTDKKIEYVLVPNDKKILRYLYLLIKDSTPTHMQFLKKFFKTCTHWQKDSSILVPSDKKIEYVLVPTDKKVPCTYW
jgi:hypothetical protein